MPKLSDKAITGHVYDLDEENSANLEASAVSKDFTQAIAKTIAESASIAKTFSSIPESIKFPMQELLESIKFPEFPVIPDISRTIKTEDFVIGRYDPPVTIKKSKWEMEKEAREAYKTELQIQVLEEQLNLYKGLQTPQYDINTGILTFMGKQIEIPLNTKLEMVCRIVLKNVANMKRKWSWDEIVEANRENVENFNARQIYTAVRSINDKVAMETQVKDLLISKPYSTVQLNPQFLAK